jgi:hypothetical protein
MDNKLWKFKKQGYEYFQEKIVKYFKRIAIEFFLHESF